MIRFSCFSVNRGGGSLAIRFCLRFRASAVCSYSPGKLNPVGLPPRVEVCVVVFPTLIDDFPHFPCGLGHVGYFSGPAIGIRPVRFYSPFLTAKSCSSWPSARLSASSSFIGTPESLLGRTVPLIRHFPHPCLTAAAPTRLMVRHFVSCAE